jgi:hypothetical protein
MAIRPFATDRRNPDPRRPGAQLHSWGFPGDPAHLVGWDLLEAKFRDCVSFANRPLIPGGVERMIELAHDLDHLEDTSEILNLLG